MKTNLFVALVCLGSVVGVACNHEREQEPEPGPKTDKNTFAAMFTQVREQPTFVESKGDDGSGEKFTRLFGKPEPLTEAQREILKDVYAAKNVQMGTRPVALDEEAEAIAAKRQALVDFASQKGGDELVPIFLTLDDLPFAWSELAAQDQEIARDEILDVRREQTKEVTSPIAEQLAKLGAVDIQEFWVIPSLFARAKAKHVPSIAKWSTLRSVEHGVAPKVELQGPSTFTGLEARNGSKATALLNAGYNGSTYARVGGPIRVGILDGPNMVTHPGYGTGRMSAFHCYGWGCGTVTPNGILGHENSVARILLGSIENGEDPNITNQTERIKRSGYAPATKFWVGGIPNAADTAAFVQSFQYAITQYFEVYNMSFHWGGGCSNTADPYGTKATLRNMAAAGTVPVYSLGNGGDPNPPNPPGSTNFTCTVNYPATNRDGVAAAGLDTPLSSTNYDTATMAPVSARGGMDLTINGTVYPKVVAVADIAAPSGYDLWYSATGGYYSDTSSSCCFTSFAAPSISGSLALLRHALRANNFTINSSNALITHLLMLGDGWDYDTNSFATSGVSSRSGVGRLHLHYPSSNNLTSPWKWSYGTTTIGPSQVFTVDMTDGGLPLPANVTQLKVVMKFIEPTYTNAADIDIHVYNTCPPGGGISYMGADTSRDVVSRVDLRSNLAGKCPRLWVQSYHVPTGQTRTADFAFLYHSGTPDLREGARQCARILFGSSFSSLPVTPRMPRPASRWFPLRRGVQVALGLARRLAPRLPQARVARRTEEEAARVEAEWAARPPTKGGGRARSKGGMVARRLGAPPAPLEWGLLGTGGLLLGEEAATKQAGEAPQGQARPTAGRLASPVRAAWLAKRLALAGVPEATRQEPTREGTQAVGEKAAAPPRILLPNCLF